MGFFIFLSVMFINVVKSRHSPSLYAQSSSNANRGSIISADGFNIAISTKLYKAVVNTRYIDPNKKNLFIELFSIYSGIKTKTIRKKLKNKNGVVVLSYNIKEKQAQYLKRLAFELRRLKVFMSLKNKQTQKISMHGLSIIESGESREYPYGNLLTPIIGYPNKAEANGYTFIRGVKGLEKRFDEDLFAKQKEISQGYRDVNSYIILNKDSFSKPAINGLDIQLNIPVVLQIKMERMLDSMKKELRAKEILLAIMDSKTGAILSIASSNRYLPKNIKKSDYPSLNSSIIEYSFEPGSVIKVVTFALLLDKGLINPYDLVNGHNGRFKIGRKTITDEHQFDWISAENVIVHSSNIGIAQLAQKLSGVEFRNGLNHFGFSKKSTPDLMYEKVGSIPNQSRLEDKIYKATCSYGYGMRANLMQLMRAYSVFNNNGRMIRPKIVKNYIDNRRRKIFIENEKAIQVIKASTAQRVKNTLIKTVNKGTGTNAITAGLIVGGKTGTAHIVENRKYVEKYNTSFLGFVNDKTHSYTMGVVVIQPKISQYASKTAVPTFKKAIDILVKEAYLKPNIIK